MAMTEKVETLNVTAVHQLFGGWSIQHEEGNAFLSTQVDPGGTVATAVQGLIPPVMLKVRHDEGVILEVVPFTVKEQKENAVKLRASILGQTVEEAQDMEQDLVQWLGASFALAHINDRATDGVDEENDAWHGEVWKFLEGALTLITTTSTQPTVGETLRDWVASLVRTAVAQTVNELHPGVGDLQKARAVLADRVNAYADLLNMQRGLIDPEAGDA